MKYIKQLLIILLVSMIGELLKYLPNSGLHHYSNHINHSNDSYWSCFADNY